MYTDSDGDIHIVGLVINDSNANAQIVEVVGEFLDASDDVVATETGLALVLTIAPGADSPFEVVLDNPPAGIAAFRASIGATQSIPFLQPIEISETITDFDGSHVAGTVRNDSGDPYFGVVVWSAVFDASGTVLRVAPGDSSPEDLGPGATGSFDATFDEPASGASSARAWAEAIPF